MLACCNHSKNTSYGEEAEGCTSRDNGRPALTLFCPSSLYKHSLISLPRMVMSGASLCFLIHTYTHTRVYKSYFLSTAFHFTFSQPRTPLPAVWDNPTPLGISFSLPHHWSFGYWMQLASSRAELPRLAVHPKESVSLNH